MGAISHKTIALFQFHLDTIDELFLKAIYMVLSLIVFTLLVLLVVMIIFYLIWVNKRQKLERESYELHQTMQKHYLQLSNILHELEPLMAHDRAFYEELRAYVQEHYTNYPVLGEVDGLEAKEFYSFLLHLERDAKDHLSTFSSPITQQLDQMKLSLMRARESFNYADNEYRFLSSSFPVNIISKLLEEEKLIDIKGTR